MKKEILIFFLFLLCLRGFSQSSYFNRDQKNGQKYFVAVDYGFGVAHWNSVFKNTEFYDKDGSVMNTDDLTFTSKSPTKNYDVNVMAPIKHMRIGLGIDFEFHYLSQLRIYDNGGEEFLLFDEGMRFDKVYLQAEVPFKFNTDKKYSFSWNLKAGWYGYTNVKRINFLGEKPFPVSFLGSTGLTIDYEMYPKVYVFVLPNLEYKLYDNARTEAPVVIRHNVFSACFRTGIRVDLGRFYN